ncbi:hypothetical protein AGMMS50229_17280 [Campylobacterota bacterium]|nr:hypothetical protein AGMMS50229_17280 [Campylobacterota bacterium]
MSATATLYIDGMRCAACRDRIKRALAKLGGVIGAEVSYENGSATVEYNEAVVNLQALIQSIEKLGYGATDHPPQSAWLKALLFLTLAITIFYALDFFGVFALAADFELATETMGYGALLVIGALTSLHCVAMCGGINLSVCLSLGSGGGRLGAFKPSLLYNLGRVAGYAIVGFCLGAIGSQIALSDQARGAIELFAAILLLAFGLSLIGVIPSPSKLLPKLPPRLALAFAKLRANQKSAFVIGLINSFMPCGALIAMQLYALGTASAVRGSLSMAFFALGTLPVMFMLGAASSMLAQKYALKALSVGGVIVMVMGLTLGASGLSLVKTAMPDLSGVGAVVENAKRQNSASAESEGDIQIVRSTLQSGRYPAITVSANKPVRWVINAPLGTLNGCNYRMIIGEYGIRHTFKSGENIIEFMPKREGVFRYSCYMGMIRSTITVTGAAN